MIEVTIQRPRDDVREALVQFCARRGYRLSDPWYLEGLRIEVPERLREGSQKRGFWATVTDAQTGPRIDVDVKRRRAKSSRVKINVGDHPDSVRLAYELQAYLNDDRSYETSCPPICTSCGSNVPNPIARYCGRCGHQFSSGSDGGDRNVLRPPIVRAASGDQPHADETMSEWLLERRSDRVDASKNKAIRSDEARSADDALELVETEYTANDESTSSNILNEDGYRDDIDAAVIAAEESSSKTIEDEDSKSMSVADAGPADSEPVSESRQPIAEAVDIEEEDIADGDVEDENARRADADRADTTEANARPTRRLLAEE